MSTTARAFLFVLAMVLGLVVYSLGTSFTYGVESIERARGSEIFWALLAVAFASPLWLPAILSSRLRPLSPIVRWLLATALLVPIYYTGAVALHQYRLYPQESFAPFIFTVSAVLGVGCTAAVVILLMRRARRADDKVASPDA